MNGIDPEALRALLRRSEMFQHLRGRHLDALAREMAWFSLPGGAPLFDAGDPSDSMYVVKAGSLGAFGVPRSGGAPRLLGVIPRGRTIGELGLITGQPRETGVRALRDSELLRLSRRLRRAGAQASGNHAGRGAQRHLAVAGTRAGARQG